MRNQYATMVLAGLLCLAATPTFCSGGAGGVGPTAAWKALEAGNSRFVSGHPKRQHQSSARRSEVARTQHPIAIIVGCSDSRVPPELAFDQGLGDLFVVRIAGNIVDDNALGSIEYAVDHLGAKLIVVLGHERCGAVAAAVSSPHAPGHVDSLVTAIQPAVEAAKKEPGDVVDNAVRENVKNMVALLDSSKPVLQEHIQAGTLKVVGARYDLDTGKVTVVK